MVALSLPRYLTYQANEPHRTGPGEQGKGISLLKGQDQKEMDEMFKKEGFNLIGSDSIALDRSLKDYRIPE